MKNIEGVNVDANLNEKIAQLQDLLAAEKNISESLRKQITAQQEAMDLMKSVYNHRSVRIAVGIQKKIDKFNKFFHLSKYKPVNYEKEESMAVLSYDSWYEENKDYSNLNTDIKTIAFYLPQFHSFKENDEWWGKGFTEWTNTKKALPCFSSHYQPREPHDDLGYYDLSDWRVIDKQAKLAKQHGIYGFCFYRYWFSGKELMEKPLQLLLEHPEIDINYCLCWANENWTRRWDGKDSEILIGQGYENDSVDYIADIKQYLEDPRYIRVDGKPVVMIYRPNLLPNPSLTFERWREWARNNGIGEILIWIQRGVANMGESVMVKGADAEVEFPPSGTADIGHYDITKVGGKKDTGNIIGYQKLVDEVVNGHATVDKFKHTVYRGVMLGWDNSPRREVGYWATWGFSLVNYYRWLRYVIEDTRKRHDKDSRFIFINAWNEWAEGTYLEPDKRFGYSSINVTSRAIFDMPLQPHIEGYGTGEKTDVFELKKAECLLSRNYPLFPYSLFNMYTDDELVSPADAWQRCCALEDPIGTLEKFRDQFNIDSNNTYNRLKLKRILLDDVPMRSEKAPQLKVAVHLHLFYQDMIGVFVNDFNNIPYPFDLFVSVPDSVKGNLKKIEKKFRDIKNVKQVVVKSCPNRGRDIAPLVCTFGKDLLNYDYIAHFHSKKSLHTYTHNVWGEFIFRHLLGSEEIVSKIFGLLDSNVGVVAPPDFLFMPEQPSGWGSNMKIAQKVLDLCKVNINLKEDFPVIEFPQGSMFWAKSEYLKTLLNSQLSFNDFPEEPIGTDGTIAHALERLFYIWGLDSGMETRQVFLQDDKELLYLKR